MAIGSDGAVGRWYRLLWGSGSAAGLGDGELIERFLARRGDPEGAEAAFEALVLRHGPTVRRVCLALLRDPNDADDAFQATFLVLARRAGSIRRRGSVGPWLHGVACRVASRVRVEAARRRDRERRRCEASPEAVAPTPPRDRDLESALHEELARLPGPFRDAVVLCDLEGLGHEEAARRLACPVGTLKSRQARGRERLRARLVRRGLAPSAALTALGIRPDPVAAALAASTARAAVGFATGGATTAGAVPAAVASLAEGVLGSLAMTKWKLGIGLMMAASAALATAVVAATGGGPDADDPSDRAERAVGAIHGEILDALFRRDDRALERLLADEVLIVEADGDTHSKAQYLTMIRDAAPAGKAPEILVTETRSFGPTVVVTSRLRPGGGEDVGGTWLLVYTKQDDLWRCVAIHEARSQFVGQGTSRDLKLPTDAEAQVEREIPWLSEYAEARAQARSLKRPILAYFTGVNAVNCRLMERNVLPGLAARIRSDFVPVRFYTDLDPDPGLSREESERRAEANLAFENYLLNAQSQPMFAVLNSNGAVIARIEGYTEPELFALFLTEAVERSGLRGSSGGPARLQRPPARAGEAAAPASIPWLIDYQEALARAREHDKPVLLYFAATATPSSRIMERAVLDRPEVVRMVAEGFVPVRLYTDVVPDLAKTVVQRKELADANGRVQLRLTGEQATPMFVAITPNSRILARTGPTDSPSRFGRFLADALAEGGPQPPGAAVRQGSLRGQVRFVGEIPSREILVRQGDPNVKDSAVMAARDILSERLVVDPETRGIKDAIVIMRDADPPFDLDPSGEVTVRFHEGRIEPHLSAFRRGDVVNILNVDQVAHNAHTMPRRNAPFNEAFRPQTSRPIRCEEAEPAPFKVVCDIHPWESAWWFVSEGPYFAVTDELGRYEIPNAPAGVRKVAVWHESVGWLTPREGVEVEVRPEGPTDRDFALDPTSPR